VREEDPQRRQQGGERGMPLEYDEPVEYALDVFDVGTGEFVVRSWHSLREVADLLSRLKQLPTTPAVRPPIVLLPLSCTADRARRGMQTAACAGCQLVGRHRGPATGADPQRLGGIDGREHDDAPTVLRGPAARLPTRRGLPDPRRVPVAGGVLRHANGATHARPGRAVRVGYRGGYHNIGLQY
jgi:hypothetical protein